MTETSVTKYMSARADGTEEKGPAMPRPRAPWEHREMQSRQRVQRLEMRQAPPSREMAKSRQAAAHCMHPVHVSFTRMRQGDSLPSKPAASPMGQNLLLETQASGAPIVDNPDVEGFGSILQGYLETSNVNPVSEITELVSAQRAYEMNSKIIQTSDQMLNTITQLR